MSHLPKQLQIRLTLLPKYFSSFPQGTYALSGSSRYLDFRRHVPSILRSISKERDSVKMSRAQECLQHKGSCTLVAAFSGRPWRSVLLRPSHSTAWRGPSNFQTEKIHCRSPLLEASLLVSLPPPTDMLKFCGFSPVLPVSGQQLWQSDRS